MTESTNTTRRQVLRLAIASLAATSARSVQADPAAMNDAIRAFTGGRTPSTGPIRLDIPSLVENGNSVPVSVRVDSPMSEGDHVRRIAVFNEKNPQPQVAVFTLGPRCGRASVATRMRMADSQQIIAVAELSDGRFIQTRADVIVTLAACIEN
jgi:sulfur-oxidizing protein SoxY